MNARLDMLNGGPPVLRSLHTRLVAMLVLLGSAAVVSGAIMFALFQQSTAAQIGQVGATAARACEGIVRTYRASAEGRQADPTTLDDPALRQTLASVVSTALQNRTGIEGGLWQPEAGAIGYAFPTYEGSGPKTDAPEAEMPRIVATVKAMQATGRASLTRFDAASMSLLIAACPLPGPIAGLSAWTMTRVHSLGSSTYWQLMTGLTVLFGSIVGACILVGLLIRTWSRHVRLIETSLSAPDGELPTLALTGERELDRIVAALNEAGRRIKSSRTEADHLGRTIARGERLAAVGRVSAGVAHEIRSPIAAMRLKAEMALSRDLDRKDKALRVVIDQVDRLDHLVGRLLSVSEPDPLTPEDVVLRPFLETCAARHQDHAARRHSRIVTRADLAVARFDRDQMSRAIGNLIANAIEAGSSDTLRVEAAAAGDEVVFSVTNRGAGPPDAIQANLFDPFVTGRPEGAGLGLSIVREVAEAHDGWADFDHVEGRTTFRVTIPCRAS